MNNIILLVSTIILGFLSVVFAIIIFNLWQRLKNSVSKKQAQELEKQLNKKIEEIKLEKQQELKQKIAEIKMEKQQEIKEKIKELEVNFKEKESKFKEELESRNQLVLEKEKVYLEAKIREEEDKMRQRVLELQESVERKETALSEKLEQINTQKEELEILKKEFQEKQEFLKKWHEELQVKADSLEEKIQKKLLEISKLSLEEAKEQVLERVRKDLDEEIIVWRHKYLSEAEDQANQIARQIVSFAIERCSSEVANELTITTVKLQNEEDKGKLIGKQGRNIQWLEKTLGVELIIDETPLIVTISGFSSIRRHIAKRTIEKLITDGRIHPASIEEMYQKAKNEIAQEIAEAGQQAVEDLGIYDFPAKLIRLIGRLKFRTSYGQNMLKHSLEMAKLAGLLADELNSKFPTKLEIDKMICIKGALLHDIGKALDEEYVPKGNHIELGEKICDMFGLDWRIKRCISSHHNTGGDKYSYEDKDKGFCIEAVIVDACDNLSGSRPGARKETIEAYLQRLEGIERVINSIPNVSYNWVMQGGRQVWVFFDAAKMTPDEAHKATHEISKLINSTVKTPQEIKIIGFREDRIVVGKG